MIKAEDVASLALLYHLNSEPWINEEAAADLQYEVQYKELSAPDEMIALPRPATDSSILQLLRGRASCRSYRPQEMPLDVFVTLLSGAYAITQLKLLPTGQSYFSRAVPSAGGLYPLEIYPVVQRVQGLADGAYHYNVRSHSLEPLVSGQLFPELRAHLLNQTAFADANVLFILSAVFMRTLTKYGARGYRYILLEAGHVAQNICLLADEQGLGSLCLGGFFDTRLNAFLGIDGFDEGVVYCIGVGYAAE